MKACRSNGCHQPGEANGWCKLHAAELEATPSRTLESPPQLPKKRNAERVWSAADLDEQLAWLIDGLSELRTRSATVILRACRDADNGQRAVDYRKPAAKTTEDDGNPGGLLNLVLDKAHRPMTRDGRRVCCECRASWPCKPSESADPVRTAVANLVGDILLVRRAVLGGLKEAAFLRGLDPETAARLVKRGERSGQGNCENCGVWVAGSGEDRLRAGRCQACYRWRLSHDGCERPRERWATGVAPEGGEPLTVSAEWNQRPPAVVQRGPASQEAPA